MIVHPLQRVTLGYHLIDAVHISREILITFMISSPRSRFISLTFSKPQIQWRQRILSLRSQFVLPIESLQFPVWLGQRDHGVSIVLGRIKIEYSVYVTLLEYGI